MALASRGNRVTITGTAENVERASDVLDGLYQRLERGQPVGAAEIDAALRMGDRRPRPTPSQVLITRRRHIPARTPMQADYIRAMDAHELVFGLGPAGTGKTYLAVAKAVSMMIKGEVDRIILSRPAVEAGERLGFLPGDLKEKVDPYLRPLYDALHDMLPGDQVAKKLEAGDIEVAPLAFMRGRTLGQFLRHPRRGAEHHAGADEDAADPAGRAFAHGGDAAIRRRSICLPAPARVWSMPWTSCAASARSAWSASPIATWSAMVW